jgi:ribosomal protein S18 acetylase RimI-like enzyme
MEYKLRALTGYEAASYNEFFAQAARAHPETLRITPGDVALQPFSTAETADAVTLVAIAPDGEWLGVVSVEREMGREKRRHIAWLVRMYVSPGAAGKGIGRELLRAGIQRARRMPGIAKLNLTVAADNIRAVGLYQSEGFREFSRETDAFRNGIQSVEELSMSLAL